MATAIESGEGVGRSAHLCAPVRAFRIRNSTPARHAGGPTRALHCQLNQRERKLVFRALGDIAQPGRFKKCGGTDSKAIALQWLFQASSCGGHAGPLPELPEPKSTRPVILPVYQDDVRQTQEFMRQCGGNLARYAAQYLEGEGSSELSAGSPEEEGC